jgi:hypothetical protein
MSGFVSRTALIAGARPPACALPEASSASVTLM